MSGARFRNCGFIDPSRRKRNFKKCVVCLKALVPRNKTQLCSKHYIEEAVLNRRYQGYFKKWRKMNKIKK